MIVFNYTILYRTIKYSSTYSSINKKNNIIKKFIEKFYHHKVKEINKLTINCINNKFIIYNTKKCNIFLLFFFINLSFQSFLFKKIKK